MIRFSKNSIDTRQNNCDNNSDEELNRMKNILRKCMWKAPEMGKFVRNNKNADKEFLDKLLIYESNKIATIQH